MRIAPTAKALSASIAAAALAACLCACGTTTSSSATSSASSSSSNTFLPQAETTSAPATVPVSGEKPLVLIVVGFAGDQNGKGAVAYRNDYDWHSVVFESDQGAASFYRDQSEDAFTWVPAGETSAYGANGNTCTADAKDDGVIHVELPRSHGQWFTAEQYENTSGTSSAYTTDEAVNLNEDFQACTIEALTAAAKYIDFAQYDTNGNLSLEGNELGVGIIYAGYDVNGDWMDMLDATTYPAMQAHQLGPLDIDTTRGNTILPGSMAIMGEMITRVPTDHKDDLFVNESAVESTQCPPSTMNHELGHCLELPDYYDTSYDASAPWAYWNAGPLSIMDTGAVLQVNKKDSAYLYASSRLDPLSRIKLGWLEPEEITKAGTYEVRADGAAGGKNVLLVKTNNPGEYFLIENRQPTGYDAILKDEYTQTNVGGIVVWHVDENIYKEYFDANQVNLPVHRPALTVQYLLSLDTIPDAGIPQAETRHTLSFTESIAPDIATAFWDSTSAQTRLAALGTDSLQLWTYGTGENADKPETREYCTIKLKFPDASADTMHVDIQL